MPDSSNFRPRNLCSSDPLVNTGNPQHLEREITRRDASDLSELEIHASRALVQLGFNNRRIEFMRMQRSRRRVAGQDREQHIDVLQKEVTDLENVVYWLVVIIVFWAIGTIVRVLL